LAQLLLTLYRPMKLFVSIVAICTALIVGLSSAAKVDVRAQESAPADSTKKVAAAGVSWLDFESGFAKAQKENKILLVDVYTDWCGWCKVMDRETYSNDTIVQKINASFVTVKLNPEKSRVYQFGDKKMTADELHKWLGYGQTFGYPTTYFMVNPGKDEDRYAQVGYMDAKEFGKILDLVITKRSN
jgi:thiol:disulfide interchange protein